jgi:hypothetical protein
MSKDEALKLASALDDWATQMDMGRKPDPKSLTRKASAELRRLQAELDTIKQALVEPAQPASCWVCGGAGVEFDDTNKTTPCPNCSEATTPSASQQKPLFADIIAQHPGLAEELKAIDEQPLLIPEPVAWVPALYPGHYITLTKPPESWGMVPLYTTPPAQPARIQPVGDWVWSWLMDWCKRQGVSPATQDSLFEMVKDSRIKFDK